MNAIIRRDGPDSLHSTAQFGPGLRAPARFKVGQTVWFVKGPGNALQPRNANIGSYGRVDEVVWLKGCQRPIYVVRCRGIADTVDETCLQRSPA